MPESDYGTTLTKGGVSVGKSQVIDWPEISTDEIDTTNHNSGGWGGAIPSGLLRAGNITLMVLMEPGVYVGLITEMQNKTVSTVAIADEIDTVTFEGFYKSVKKESADATAPNAIRASVVLAVSGAVDVA